MLFFFHSMHANNLWIRCQLAIWSYTTTSLLYIRSSSGIVVARPSAKMKKKGKMLEGKNWPSGDAREKQHQQHSQPRRMRFLNLLWASAAAASLCMHACMQSYISVFRRNAITAAVVLRQSIMANLNR